MDTNPAPAHKPTIVEEALHKAREKVAKAQAEVTQIERIRTLDVLLAASLAESSKHKAERDTLAAKWLPKAKPALFATTRCLLAICLVTLLSSCGDVRTVYDPNLGPVDRHIDTEMNVVCYVNHRSVSCLEIPKTAELPRPKN